MFVSKAAEDFIRAGHEQFLSTRKETPDETDCKDPKNPKWCRKFYTCVQLCQGQEQEIDIFKDAKHGATCRFVFPGTQGGWEEKKGGRYVAHIYIIL